jgi:GT2 family glycosyltransferase
LPDILVSVVIPTLAADSRLEECLASLDRQTRRDFEVIVVDNSGQGSVRRKGVAAGVRVIENRRNAGFGAAINQGFEASAAPYLATLNRKTAVDPQHGRQVRDLSGVSTAAQFTQWVTTAFAANTCG